MMLACYPDLHTGLPHRPRLVGGTQIFMDRIRLLAGLSQKNNHHAIVAQIRATTEEIITFYHLPRIRLAATQYRRDEGKRAVA